MIQDFLNSVTADLGATGVLIIGLYLFLGRPLQDMVRHLGTINHELGDIRDLLKDIFRDIRGKD